VLCPADVLYALDKLIPRLKPYREPSKTSEAPDLPAEIIKQLEPFAQLKRDLVRLIGTLAHRNKAVQDRVRARGGVEIVLSLCVVDDRSPCGWYIGGNHLVIKLTSSSPCTDIREHALFAVRNLMMGNPDNQAVIGEMSPIGVVGEDGLLKEMPERMGLKATR
jgi:ataxin-10